MFKNRKLAVAEIEKLNEIEKQYLILQYEQFVKAGEIDSCTLRDLAMNICKKIDDHSQVTVFMTQIACECYKYFAYRYLESSKNGQ